MHVLLSYGYHPGTTGDYLERALRQAHTVTFAGSTDGSRPRQPLDVDLAALWPRLDPRPDLYLWVDSGGVFNFPRGAEHLPIPTAAYLIDVHLDARLRRLMAWPFDHLFVAQRDCLPDFDRPGQPAHWLPLAHDPAVHRPLPLAEQFDIGFVGSTDRRYARRRELLAALAARYSLNDFGRRYRPTEMVEVYARSRLVFNCTVRGDLNMRVFETLGCGRLLLTDRIENGLADLFEDGAHLVTFADEAELLDRAAEYLADDARRRRVAAAGHELALARHTYAHRVATLLETVASCSGAVAPARGAAERERHATYARIYSLLRAPRAVSRQVAAAWRSGRPGLAEGVQLAAAVLRRANDRRRRGWR